MIVEEKGETNSTDFENSLSQTSRMLDKISRGEYSSLLFSGDSKRGIGGNCSDDS